MLTLTSILQRHFGVRYEQRLKPFDAWDWKDARDTLLVGPLGPKRTGTCASLPVLVMATAQRLAYPVYLVEVPGHALSRWDSHPGGGLPRHPHPAFNGRFNIECHGDGMATPHDDRYRSWPTEWPPEIVHAEKVRPRPRFLRSLEPSEVLAHFILERAFVLMEHGQYDDCFVASMQATKFCPDHPVAPMVGQEAHKAKLQAVLKPWGISEEQFFEVLRRRQQGAKDDLPWEAVEQDHLRPGVSCYTKRPPNPHPDSLIADPVAAAMVTFFQCHERGVLKPGTFSTNVLPESKLAIKHRETKESERQHDRH